MNVFVDGPTGVLRPILACEDYEELEVFEMPTCLETVT